MAAPAYTDLLVRLAIDAFAIAVLAYGIYYRRHRRTDLFVIYSMFNVGLFAALIVISSGKVNLGVGLGLFGVLSIIRLRSEPFSNSELAYFFLALVLALATGIDMGSLGLGALLVAVVLVAAIVVDHPRLVEPARRLDVTLDTIHESDGALRRDLEVRLRARVIAAEVLEIDYVREITRVSVRCSPAPERIATLPEPAHSDVRAIAA